MTTASFRLTGVLWKAVRVLLIVSALVPVVMCANLTKDMRTEVPDPAMVLRVAVEDWRLTTPDGLTIRGWYIPGQPGQAAVILCHGVGSNRLQMVPQAEFLASMGHPVVLFDFRNHGQSDRARTSYGAWERHDVAAVSAELAQRLPGVPQVIWGLSLGATTALLAAPDLSPVKGVIAESPFDTLRDTFAHHNRLYIHLPEWPFLPLTLAAMQWSAGFDPDEVAPIEAVTRLSVPVLFVTSAGDERMPPDIVRRIAARHQGLTEIFEGEGGHALIYPQTGPAYRKQVARFLARAGQASPSP